MTNKPKDGGPACRVYKEFCSEHDFTHGAEAEELRSGIETIMADMDEEEAWSRRALQRLLDKTDARDSLAFLSARSGEEEKEK